MNLNFEQEKKGLGYVKPCGCKDRGLGMVMSLDAEPRAMSDPNASTTTQSGGGTSFADIIGKINNFAANIRPPSTSQNLLDAQAANDALTSQLNSTTTTTTTNTSANLTADKEWIKGVPNAAVIAGGLALLVGGYFLLADDDKGKRGRRG